MGGCGGGGDELRDSVEIMMDDGAERPVVWFVVGAEVTDWVWRGD